jgi:hypothetical protein
MRAMQFLLQSIEKVESLLDPTLRCVAVAHASATCAIAALRTVHVVDAAALCQQQFSTQCL